MFIILASVGHRAGFPETSPVLEITSLLVPPQILAKILATAEAGLSNFSKQSAKYGRDPDYSKPGDKIRYQE